MRTYYSSEIGVDTYFVEMLMNSRNQLKKEKRKEKRKNRVVPPEQHHPTVSLEHSQNLYLRLFLLRNNKVK